MARSQGFEEGEWFTSKATEENDPVVLQMEDVNDDDRFRTDGDRQRQRGSATPLVQTLKANLAQNVTNALWEQSREKASQAISLYANIDLLRPYFDVEPREVKMRLLQSLYPRVPVSWDPPRELYGPVMLLFTLVAILLYQMKLAAHSVQDGTLIGTAIAVGFGYWFAASGTAFALGFLCSCTLSLVQIMSIIGYGLFSHCIVLLISTMVHTSHDHLLFYGLWFVVGGLAGIRMTSIFASRTPSGIRHQIALCFLLCAMHMLFLLLLHFSYHEPAELASHERLAAEQIELARMDPMASLMAQNPDAQGVALSLAKRSIADQIAGLNSTFNLHKTDNVLSLSLNATEI